MQLSDAALDLERLYLSSPNVYQETVYPVHERWTRILTKLPLIRGRHLLDDMTDVFQDAYRSDDREKLLAGWDLAQFRYRFAMVLFEARLIPTHVLYVEYEDQQLWLRRFVYKIGHLRPAERKGNRFLKQKIEPHTLTWLN